jgi:hypothetical protein
MTSAMADWKAGSSTVPVGFETRSRNDCDGGACGPAFAFASLKTRFASIDSYFAPWSRETASTARFRRRRCCRRRGRSSRRTRGARPASDGASSRPRRERSTDGRGGW